MRTPENNEAIHGRTRYIVAEDLQVQVRRSRKFLRELLANCEWEVGRIRIALVRRKECYVIAVDRHDELIEKWIRSAVYLGFDQ
jgi:hypothetical protein